MKRENLVAFLDKYLKSEKFNDYSLNGLQVEGKKEINKILFSVSVSSDVIRKAADIGADMIIVHHGLFWKNTDYRIIETMYDKIKILIEHGINLCAWHLPLDAHKKIGNNMSLMNLFKAIKTKKFAFANGEYIGFKGEFSKPKTIAEIMEIVKGDINENALCLDFGPKKIRTLAIVSGGAQKYIYEAIKEKVDLYLTGEASEFCFEAARENNINFIALGHYASEKLGIQNLRTLLEKKFKIKTFFYDVGNPI